MLLCAITDRSLLSTNDDPQGFEGLASAAGRWATAGLDYVQVREKDLPPDTLLRLTRTVVAAVRAPCLEGASKARTRVLLNVSDVAQIRVAEAAETDGIHLAAGAPACRRLVAGRRHGLLSVGCHTLAEVEAAREWEADVVLFAPVFEKRLRTDDIPLKGQGLRMLEACCRAAAGIPVLALGGVTAENAGACFGVGAAGIAGIRVFLDEGWRRLLPAGDQPGRN